MDGHRSVGANVERLEERKGDSEGVRASEQRKRERERERERDEGLDSGCARRRTSQFDLSVRRLRLASRRGALFSRSVSRRSRATPIRGRSPWIQM
jgi:hypothetical protein